MKRLVFISIALFICVTSCEHPSNFTKESKQEVFLDLLEKEVTFAEIISNYKGQKILIDIWASWCADCIVGFPSLRKVQAENPEVNYLFLSLDKSTKSWKSAIDRYQLEGDHYFMKEGKKGPLGDFLNLWWVPRYVVVNEQGNITLFKATKITDKNISEALKK